MALVRTGVRSWVVLLALVVAGAAPLGCGGRSAPPAQPGPGCQPADPSVTCNVLFLGNSYTAVNDLPAMLTKLTASAGLTVSTRAHDPAGTTLADHLAAP